MNRIIQCLILGTTLSLAAVTVGPALASPPTPPAKADAKATAEHVQGAIVAVSAKDHTITVRTTSGEHVYAVAPKATFTRDGKTVSISEIKSGQKIDATMTKLNGKEVVQHGTISA